MAFYICSLRNEKGAGRIPQLITDDPAAVEAFAKKWDVPGRGVFECIAYLKPGATRRCRETVGTLWRLPVDIDFKDWVETPAEIDRTLQALPLPLSWARNSGDGRHVEYLLKEHAQVADEEYFERASQALKQLAVRLGGDPLPTHPAALLRKPLTHNSKRGEPVLVAPLWGNGQVYDLTEVEALIELLPETGPFTAKTRGNGHDRAEGGPRLASGYKAPVDVDRRLADMRHKGPGDSSIHFTELHCTGSLVRCGCPVDDTVFTVLQAVRKAVANDPSAASWDWTQEEFDIRKMCTDLVCKNPELSATLPDSLREPFEAAVAAGRRTWIVYAKHIGWHVRSKEKKAGEAGDSGPKQAKPDKETGNASSPWPTPYSGRAASQIPLRSFVLGQHYLIGATSITASAGGIGKSTLSLLDGVSFNVGRNLLTGETLDKRRKVWIWNAEDDLDEMERRLAGICAHYGINREDLRGWLFLDSGYDLPLDLAHGNGKGAVIQEPTIDLIAARVKQLEIEVVALDPLVALHTMAEGDNPGHAKLIRTLSTRLAKPSSCAVDINAHTRKPGIGQDAMTVDDIRGAGAIIYSARSGRILHPMSLAEAQKYDIEADDRFSYYRLERAKANMAKRGTICWVHMIEVPIANRPDGSYGDTVAVPAIWMPPDPMDGITETIASAIASEIAKGEYKRDARAGTAWAGRLVGLRCGIDTGTKAGKERAKAVLETLIKKGVLAIDIRYDSNRNSREYVVPGVLHAR